MVSNLNDELIERFFLLRAINLVKIVFNLSVVSLLTFIVLYDRFIKQLMIDFLQIFLYQGDVLILALRVCILGSELSIIVSEVSSALCNRHSIMIHKHSSL